MAETGTSAGLSGEGHRSERALRRIDRYELLEQVGSGGMAVVYRGRDTALDREIAVKLLHPHLAARRESRARFSREARAVARLSHPNIVEIFDYSGDAAVESYLVTEYVRGRTLRAFAEEEGVGFPEVGALLVRALADALAHAHGAGVIHRDLKPENVLVLEDGGRRAVKLVDFGIARIVASDERMTMTGALVGSPNHMAPEIIEGREADARSDVFSLGTILFWLATGELPFAGSNPTATLRRVIEGDHRDPRDVAPLVSDALAEVVESALEPAPEKRMPSAAALRDALDAALADAGLRDPEAELAAFLAHPATFKASLRGRLAGFALERGESALAAGETARALRLFDRVLALDPENARVRGLLAVLERRARLARAARGAAVGLCTLALVAVAGWAIVASRSPRGQATSGAQAGEGSPGAAPSPGALRPEEAPQGPPARPSAATPQRAPAPAPGRAAPPAGASAAVLGGADTRSPVRPPAEVAVHVRPYAQRAFLDGVELARGEQRVTFALSLGRRHVVRIEHDCCFPFVREFGASEVVPQPLELKVPLEPRPARLRVDGDPATRIILDGRLLGTAGDSQREPLAIAVPPGSDSPYEGQAELRLELAGRAPQISVVRIRAGGEISVAALKPEAILR